MKKIINDVNNVVDDMVNGIVKSNAMVKRLEGFNVIVRSDANDPLVRRKVTLISGGGSGHEPAFSGYIGKSLLSAAVFGEVFASPSPKQIYEAIKAVIGDQGCILLVMNYTGDRLNFGIAAEMARTQLGKRVELIIVADDVSLIDPNDTINKYNEKSRRGICGTLLSIKCIGAAIQSQNYSIDECIQLYNGTLRDSVNTMGVGLSSCIIPSVGKPSFTLSDNEIEFGLGIHGEPGIKKLELQSSEQIVKQIIETIFKNRPLIKDKKNLIVLLNNLGSTTHMELQIVANDIIKLLCDKMGYIIKRFIIGTLMTSLEMAGISITLFSLEDNHLNLLLDLIDYPTNAQSWPSNHVYLPNINNIYFQYNNDNNKGDDNNNNNKEEFENFKSIEISNKQSNILKKMIEFGCKCWIENLDLLNQLDGKVGDGDIGTTLSKISETIQLQMNKLDFNRPCFTLLKIAHIIQDSSGGSIAPFLSIFFIRFSNTLFNESKSSPNQQPTPLHWLTAFKSGIMAIQEIGQAKKGDSTILDSLYPAHEAIQDYLEKNKVNEWNLGELLKISYEASNQGAESTINMISKAGRSQYLGERSRNNIDPGSKAISLIFNSFLKINE